MQSLIRRLCCGILLIALAAGCRSDRRVTIFEMVFPNIQFEMPAGLTGTLPRVFEQVGLRTNYRAYLTEFEVDASQVGGIVPISATLTSLNGERFNFLRQITIRICDFQANECTNVEEFFYLDNMQNQRIGSEVQLLPTLIDAQPILSRDRFKMEVWFYFFGVSPTNIPIRLDLRFDAVE